MTRRRTMWLKTHRISLASVCVVALAAGALMAYALAAPGYSTRHAALNDGGIWVSNESDGYVARLNVPAQALDAAFDTPGDAVTKTLDVLQDASTVVATNADQGKAFPVAVDRAVAVGDAALGITAQDGLAVGGGTVAMVDQTTGKVWATRAGADGQVSSLASLASTEPPLGTVGPGAAVVVDQDGVVHAAGLSGKTLTLTPSTTDFSPPVYSESSAMQSVTLTTVGTELVALDAKSYALLLPRGRSVSLRGTGNEPVLQLAGPAASSVLLETSSSLLSVDLNTGGITALYSKATGTPTNPVRLDACVHGAWGGPGSYVRACGGGPATAQSVSTYAALIKPRFRVNRDSIVLNDVANGNVFDLDTNKQLANWQAVTPPPISKNASTKKNDNTSQAQQQKPPNAQPDDLGVRPGRTTVLHVLDNDSDPAGRILAIDGITGADPALDARVSPDKQTISVSVPAGAGDSSFSYSIDDGTTGLKATATVALHTRGPSDEKVPALRTGYVEPVWSVAAGGVITLPILSNWRDYDGDPLILKSATANVGSVTTTADGELIVKAPASGTSQTVNYQVWDGVGAPVSAQVSLKVIGPSGTATAATPEPDVAAGQVGQPIVLHPLDNDLPGADPSDPSAGLTLAAAVSAPAGLTASTDLSSGAVTLTASKPGTFLLTYAAAYGAAPTAQGHIRLDVTGAGGPQSPIAEPDTGVLHGQQPTILDVLANDFDPAGRVLTVQNANAAEPADVQVAIVSGHWLRLEALKPTLGQTTELVHYTITDGIGAAVGEVEVTQLPVISPDTPVTEPDYATVRAGDVVTIPVLDNDSTPGGDPISLVSDVPGAPAPGQLPVTATGGATSNVGDAYVSGNVVRYVAPAVATQQTFQIQYSAQDPLLDRASGYAYVTVNPPPSTQNPDAAPEPQEVDARVVAGDTVTVPIPTSGVDPDGDAVTVTGLASASTGLLGRVLSVGANSLTYQAFPTAGAGGTDSFAYTVADKYGLSGSAQVRVAVVQPGAPQPPVAVDQTVVGAPGSTVSVDVRSVAIVAPDDTITESLLDGGSPAHLAGPQDPIVVQVPGGNGRSAVVRYSITDGLASSTASIHVFAVAGWKAPPHALDAFARPPKSGDQVTIDLSGKIASADGTTDGLKISRVYDTGAQIRGTTVVLTAARQARVVPYEVRSSDGATAVASIFVPGVGAGLPYAKGSTIALAAGATKTINIGDYVVDPAGKTLILADRSALAGAPASGLTATFAAASSVTLKAGSGYDGPAALWVEVADAPLGAAGRQTTWVSLPVQVGAAVPVLRCPPNAISVIEGGQPVDIPITAVCHVWYPDATTAANARFTGELTKPLPGVTVGGNGTTHLSVTAGNTSVADSTGMLKVSVQGSPALPGSLTIQVTATPPPSISAMSIDGVKAGSSATLNVAGYVTSPFVSPSISVVSITPNAVANASVSHQGSSATITPAADSHGVMVFSVVATDSASAQTAREVTGQLTVNVLGKPDAPGTPQPDRTVLSRVVELSWPAPASNGAPIDYYQVDYSGGTQQCSASPCSITGLTNGRPYSFTVRAHNVVGFGSASPPSASATPDAVPDAVTGVVATALGGDTSLTSSVRVQWAVPADPGSPVNGYQLRVDGVGVRAVSGTSTVVTGLTNGQLYQFSVQAGNSAPSRWGPYSAKTSAVPFGVPPAVTHVTADPGDQDVYNPTSTVTVSWDSITQSGNDGKPAKFIVTQVGSDGSATVSHTTDLTSQPFTVQNQGLSYTYSVVATNTEGKESAATSSGSITAVGQPDAPTIVSAATPSANSTVQIVFKLQNPRGKRFTAAYWTTTGPNPMSNESHPWDISTYKQGSQVAESITSIPTSESEKITITVKNELHWSTPSGPSDPFQTYGPPGQPQSAGCSNPSVQQIVFSWSQVSSNGRPIDHYEYSQDGSTGWTSTTDTSTQPIGYQDYSTPHTMYIRSADSLGDYSSNLAETCYTGSAPPPPTPTITASNGAVGTSPIGSCTSTDENCHWLAFQVHNFPTGSFTWSCQTNGSTTYTSTSRFTISDPNESFSGEHFCLWGSGVGPEQITINGVQSPPVAYQ